MAIDVDLGFSFIRQTWATSRTWPERLDLNCVAHES